MRWGIVGYGWVARDYMAPAIRASGGRLVGVADPCAEARQQAQTIGARAFRSADELVGSGDCDLIYVATPNHCHLEPVAAAASARLPVLCEKPMAANLSQAELIAARIGETGTLYGTAFEQRHHPAHKLLKSRLADGDIGRPTALRIVYGCWVDPLWCPTGAPNWRADPDAAGGGAAIDLALHGLDLSEFLLGEPIVDLIMMLQRRLHAYEVDDGGMLLARSASGVLVSVHVAYNCPESLPRRRLELIGEVGQYTATDTMGQTPGGGLTRTCGKTGLSQELAFDEITSPFTVQAAAFASAAQGAPHDWSPTRDLRLMRLFDLAHREARACL